MRMMNNPTQGTCVAPTLQHQGIQMIKARDSIHEVVKRGIAPMLKAHGFKKTGLHFARRNGAVVHYLNVQLSSWNSGDRGSFYLNTGVMFDELCLHFGKQPPALAKHDDCQFMVRLNNLNPELPQLFDVDGSTDLHALAGSVAQSVEQSFVVLLEEVNSLESFGKTGWVNAIPWGFPALYHYVTGDRKEARRLVQLEADIFSDRGLTFQSVAEGLRLSFA